MKLEAEIEKFISESEDENVLIGMTNEELLGMIDFIDSIKYKPDIMEHCRELYIKELTKRGLLIREE